jgi:hypothetical protein
LAHEVVHLLAPLGRGGAIVFEEGLATAFAHEMSAVYGSFHRSQQVAYLQAETLLQTFLSIYPDGVRLIRMEQPSFNSFSPELICRICPKTPETLAEALCQPFVRGP